jgi:cellulose synthase operon protein C
MAKISWLVFCPTILATICATTTNVARAVAEDPSAIKVLLSRAQIQAQGGHLNIAILTWQQVLAADPVNIDALRNIAAAEVQMGRQTEANAYIRRLQKAGGSTALVEQLQSMHARPSDAVLSKQAARMAESGQYSEAMEVYHKLYGDNPPAGDPALAYYDTLAALPAERKHAVEGLRRLSRQFPADERYSVALGRVLTYDPTSRSEGMALLAQFTANRNAGDALKQATTWNERAQEPRDVPAGNLPAHANRPTGAIISELGAGFRALNAGKLSQAEEHFHRALAKEITHGQAHAGLGFIRMQQHDFVSAVQEFEQAEKDGDRESTIVQSLENARFWNAMGEAREALDSGDWKAAIASYRIALTLNPDNLDALSALGGTLMRAAQPKEAIPYLERAVRADAGSRASWRALFLAQSQASQQADAVKTAELIPMDIRTELEADPTFMGSLAADYAAIGEKPKADSTLNRALVLLQNEGSSSPSIPNQLEYASLLMMAKRYNSAIRSYRTILAVAPDNADAWRAMIAADHLAGRDDEALRAFRLMPSAVSASMQKDASFLSILAGIYQTQGQIERASATLDRAIKLVPSTELELQLASLEMSDGDKAYAVELYAEITVEHPESSEAWLGYLQALHATNRDRDALRPIHEMPEDIAGILTQNPTYLQVVGSIYGAVGDRRGAAKMIMQVEDLYAQKGMDLPAPVQLQQGWLSLQAGDNARLSAVIQALSADEDLTDDQQAQFAHLWASWAAQRASRLAQLGHRAAAVEVLAKALRVFPNDVSLNNALANQYLADGDPKRAQALYARQDMSQADAAVCAAAINAALSANDRKQAQTWLQMSLERFQHDPKVLELAARFEQQRGDMRRAAAYDRAALQAAGRRSVAELTSAGFGTVSSDEEMSSRQELFELLAAKNPGSALSQRSRSIDNLDQANAREPLSPIYSKPLRDTDDLAGSQSEPLDYDTSVPPSRMNGTRRHGRADSMPNVAGSAKNMDFPMPRKEGPSLVNLAEHKNPRIADESATSVTAEMPSHELREEDAQSFPMTSTPSPETGRQSAVISRTPTGSDSAAPNPYAWAAAPGFREPLKATDRAVVANKMDSFNRPELLTANGDPSRLAALQPSSSVPVESLPPLTGLAHEEKQPLSPREQMEQNLQAIESSSSPYVGGSSSVVFHSGQPGFDRLTIFGADIEQSTVLGMKARATIVAHPVVLQSGSPLASASSQLGTLPLGAVSGIQTAAGVGGEVQFRTRSFGAALGSTPRGFLVQNIMGRLLIQPNNGPVTFSFDRQPIEETQLSYAGLRDPGSMTSSNAGNIWGGVISNAGSVLINHNDAVSGWYLQGGGQYISGKHVATNHRIDGYAGAYWSLWDHPDYGKLTLGMNFFGMHYANNQRLFTYGNGGYFSPGAYLLSSVPISFEGSSGPRFHYRAAGSLGLQAFQEDASPYYPLDSALQAAANNPYSLERLSVGPNYGVEGEASYLITDHWHIGGFFSVNNAYDYTNDRAGFFLRYAFMPQSMDAPQGPTGLGSGRGLRPLFTR